MSERRAFIPGEFHRSTSDAERTFPRAGPLHTQQGMDEPPVQTCRCVQGSRQNTCSRVSPAARSPESLSRPIRSGETVQAQAFRGLMAEAFWEAAAASAVRPWPR